MTRLLFPASILMNPSVANELQIGRQKGSTPGFVELLAGEALGGKIQDSRMGLSSSARVRASQCHCFAGRLELLLLGQSQLTCPLWGKEGTNALGAFLVQRREKEAIIDFHLKNPLEFPQAVKRRGVKSWAPGASPGLSEPIRNSFATFGFIRIEAGGSDRIICGYAPEES